MGDYNILKENMVKTKIVHTASRLESRIVKRHERRVSFSEKEKQSDFSIRKPTDLSSKKAHKEVFGILTHNRLLLG